jgi:hypothetical protein
VPLTDALFDALRDHRHLRGEHVLFGDDGRPAMSFFLRRLLEAAQKRAGIRPVGCISFVIMPDAWLCRGGVASARLSRGVGRRPT